MPTPHSFDYAVIRVVPRVEREEFVNVGVIVYCLAHDLLVARVEPDFERLRRFAPGLDLDEVRRHLESIPRICAGGPDAGPIGKLPQKDRFHWLVAPRSTVVQTGPVHSGLAQAPDEALDRLMSKMVR